MSNSQKITPVIFEATRPFVGVPGDHSIVLEVERPSEASMLRSVLATMDSGEDCQQLFDTYPSLKKFAEKLAKLMTHHFPTQSTSYKSGIAEVLDTALAGYFSFGATKEPRDQVAKFMANSVLSATNSLLSYSVHRNGGRVDQPWDAWSDPPLAEWFGWNSQTIVFKPAYSVPAEVRYAMRNMLSQKLLKYADIVAIARAGIDIHSLELF